MDIKSFIIDESIFHERLDGPAFYTKMGSCNSINIQVKTLSAYAIDHSFLIQNGINIPVDGVKIKLKDDFIIVSDEDYIKSIDNKDVLVFQIYHYGIKKYENLFPEILKNDRKVAERLGRYYSEAEACFNSGAWLSFSLMAGAIFEQMLAQKIGKCDTLNELSKSALSRGIINKEEFEIIDKIRNDRNLVHANKVNQEYIERSDAMDARALVDRLIIRI